ncbi:MAG: LpqN/LpqT family lipoprotein [Gordonia sp. (in: high G+C Gram-positive bacteria)]|nr:LpqN/LpqT family lipoprotein [Gordonia sp. (in: high G+C Gram-positive bacteria)]
MTISTLMRGLAVTASACALVVGVASCSKDDSSGSSASTTSTSTTPASTTSTAPTTSSSTGANPTIADYIKQQGITETQATPGENGAPSISMPTPDGWAQVEKGELPEYALGAIKYSGSQGSNYTANIVALFSKLTGPVDVDKLFELAPGELRNLDDFSEIGSGHKSTLSGFGSYKMAGQYTLKGMTVLTAQQTVVIEAADAVYVLQLNATSNEDQADALQKAMDAIDEQTTITA